MTDVDRVRLAIYRLVVEEHAVPTVPSVASACALPDTEVAEAFRTLAAGHVIVLLPNSVDLWAAPPFSTAPTGFCVRSGGQTWFAVCAWEAFGIPAALRRDAVIEARCGWSGETIHCGVGDGRATGDDVVHLLVPAARFWDDIFYT